ncbi:MAG: arginine repressor [Clostridia bacterium]|nr:arginine repressor [Clostridia bacterium]
MKNQRLEKVKELIARFEIETQDELIDKLGAEGFAVTQATVSRDIRELKISKVLGANGKYHYAMSEHAAVRARHSYMASIQSVAFANNLVVIKTGPGLAQAVAAELDSMDHGEILGCVAGDDTILAVAVSDAIAAIFCENLKKRVGLL